jgi:hypothetical protein
LAAELPELLHGGDQRKAAGMIETR